jgi:Na+/H+-dicarboxylate symporter
MFKKNALIKWIVLAMIAGIVTGYFINRSIVQNKFAHTPELTGSISSAELQAQVETVLSKYEAAAVTAQKKNAASYFSILSDIFLHLIKMIIAPLVLAVLVTGVAKLGDFKSVGRIGIKTLLYFTSATLIALFLGLVLVNVFKPGKVMHLTIPESTQSTGITPGTQTARNFIDHVIPESIIRSMSSNDILPIVIFALFFGVAAAACGAVADPIIKVFDSLGHIMFKVTEYVMNFAPVGVFGAITSVVVQQGPEILKGYIYLIACFFCGLIFFAFVVLFIVCLVFRIPYFRLLKAIREPVLLAFSTASSESAMPKTIEALEAYGISNRIVSFVLPLGYSFNLDGSIMYMTFATMFIAQSYGIDISAAGQVKMMLILLVTSKGMAGVPRASLVVIAGMLSMFSIPAEGLLLLLAVDQILDMGRSATNVIGNAVASAVVGRLEGEKF